MQPWRNEREHTIDIMNSISNWEDVPLFDREEAEAAFWAETKIDVRLMEEAATASSESSDSVTITLRIDPRMLARIKRLARSRYLNYQSMIKQWLSERMEQELREQRFTSVRSHTGQ
jgi:predicted DNA binding CopG/RHH family protein